ncbi:hypothetical protein [Colwellia sp. Bg11-28]|uniref:hypothetical protein n=1 Tax=Colwellia sp. Bg11-28 TaxID=2058305 RepID=UPI000C33E785|nr:hypothetical protein [Colwellia sp. Bg11-28]PKH88903.1 hypothetical protein CXF79_03185 [Colwellia sp. Bg11-28]
MTGQDTEKLLRDAFARLLEGKPINTEADGKVSIKRINDEATLSLSSIYYYKDFVKEAKIAIRDYKISKNKKNSEKEFDAEEEEITKLRAELKNEKRLKSKYRDEKNNQKSLNNEVVIENTSLAYRLFELHDEQRNTFNSNVFPF